MLIIYLSNIIYDNVANHLLIKYISDNDADVCDIIHWAAEGRVIIYTC